MIKILGHRGGIDEVIYQNSMQSFDHSLINADGFESDACKTKDKDIFLVHDTAFIEKVEYELCAHLDDKSKNIVGSAKIEELATETISNLRLKVDDAELPRLSHVLEKMQNYPDAVLNLELKGEDTAIYAVNTLNNSIKRNHITARQIIISSFNHAQLLEVKKAAPNIKIGLLFSASFQPKNKRLYPWSNNDYNCYLPFASPLLSHELTQKIQPDFFNLEESDLTKDNIINIKDTYPKAGIITWWLPDRENKPSQNSALWDKVNDPVIRRNLYAIISNYPAEMKQYYNKIYI